MKEWVRKALWRILGIDYYTFLRHQKGTYLDELKQFKIGKGTYNNGAVVWRWLPEAQLTIGNYCSIASGVEFFLDSGFHDYSRITTFPLFSELFKRHSWEYRINGDQPKSCFARDLSKKYSVRVGNDVWIGANAMIMPGVTIADGAVVLPGSIVTGNIGPYEIHGGVPTKLKGKRFSDEIIEQLLQIKWWNWDEQLIRQRIRDFYDNPEDFVKKYQVACTSVS